MSEVIERTTYCEDFQLVATDFKVAELVAQLAAHPEIYDKYAFRTESQHGESSPHRDAQDIWVRFNPAERMDTLPREKFTGEHISQWYAEAYKIPQIFLLAADVCIEVRAEILGGIYIIRVPPKKKVHGHIDFSWHNQFYDKYFVCLSNSESGEIWWNNNTLRPKAGELWKFENDVLHGVNNDSEDTDLIIATFNIRTFQRAILENLPSE